MTDLREKGIRFFFLSFVSVSPVPTMNVSEIRFMISIPDAEIIGRAKTHPDRQVGRSIYGFDVQNRCTLPRLEGGSRDAYLAKKTKQHLGGSETDYSLKRNKCLELFRELCICD